MESLHLMEKEKQDEVRLEGETGKIIAAPGQNIQDWSWGGEGGGTFNDGVHMGIKEIILTSNGSFLYSIQTIYCDENGHQFIAGQRGRTGNKVFKVTFKTGEVLERVSGYTGPYGGTGPVVFVKALTFYTNKGTYGPFGQEVGEFFSSPQVPGKIVGFFGRCGYLIDKIGAHILYNDNILC